MTIFIPTPLRPLAGGNKSLEVSATTVAGALDELTRAYPDLKKHLFNEQGKVRAFVNLYLNDEDVRYLPRKEESPVSAADTLSIIPSIAGGCLAGRERSLRGQKVCLRTDCRGLRRARFDSKSAGSRRFAAMASWQVGAIVSSHADT
ncbi:MAG: MoaD/ThiS family protein [Terracidiphilus sp.]